MKAALPITLLVLLAACAPKKDPRCEPIYTMTKQGEVLLEPAVHGDCELPPMVKPPVDGGGNGDAPPPKDPPPPPPPPPEPQASGAIATPEGAAAGAIQGDQASGAVATPDGAGAAAVQGNPVSVAIATPGGAVAGACQGTQCSGAP